MACKMTDEHWGFFNADCEMCGEEMAKSAFNSDGSLGSARNAAIAAFTRGFDEAAAELLETSNDSPE